MKRRRLIFYCALVLVAAGMVALWPRGPKEPVYQGKKLSEWIEEVNSGVDSNQIQGARLAIGAIGTNALPYLMSEFTKPKRKLAATLNGWASRVNWDLKLEEGPKTKEQLASELYLLGPAATPALPTLAQYLGTEGCAAYAGWVMSACGEPALPYLTNALTSTNDLVSSGALTGLFYLSKDTEAAIPHLLAVLRHPDAMLRFRAAIYFSVRKESPEVVIPILIEGLTNRQVSWGPIRAAKSLGDYGTEARPAIPQLLRLFNGSHASVSFAASNALHRIDPTALPRAAAP